MADQMYNNDISFNLLSKSSPSQFQQFQFNKRVQNEKIPPLPSNGSNNKPSNLSHVPCKFYKQGACTAGANCTFSHSSDLSSQAAVCKYYLKGNCKFGTKCALLHTMSPFSSNSNNNNRFIAMTPPNQSTLMDYQPMLSPPSSTTFGTSAPAPSLLWRHNNDFIGFHSSPRESSSIDYLLGTSPFSPSRSYNNVFDDVNDVMLPSSLNNDVFTPIELQQRRARQITPEAINIPNHQINENYSHHSSMSSKPSLLPEDDEVQFYMEDDAYDDHKTVDKITSTTTATNTAAAAKNTYKFPSLLSLP